MKKNSRTKSIGALALATAMLLGTGVAFLDGAKNVEASSNMTTDSSGAITYDTGEFKVTEDYAPFVMSAMPSTAGGTSWLDAKGETKMRLDDGKSGLLIESVQTGDDVEGDEFSFTNMMNGDFSMDFRVFSEVSALTNIGTPTAQTYNGYNGASYYYKDSYNPYMDIRRVGIRITSVTNPDASFIIYVHGGQNGVYQHQASVRVQIEGEEYLDGGIPGYGLVYDGDKAGAKPSAYGYATALDGTSFSNVDAIVSQRETYSTTIKFDPETMCVYGVRKFYRNNTKNGSGSTDENLESYYYEQDKMVRNLDSNSLTEDDGDTKVTGAGLQTLSAEDFADGYTTSVFIDSMTSNDTKLTVATSSSTGDDTFHNAVATPLSEWQDGAYASSKYGAANYTYDRTAKMVIYSVNGQSLRKTEDWTVEENEGNKMLSLDTPEGLSQIDVTSYDESTDYKISYTKAEYTTAVKYGTQAGSTMVQRTIDDGLSGVMHVGFANPWTRWCSDKMMPEMYVYLEDNNYANDRGSAPVDEVWYGTASDYKVTLCVKGFGKVGQLKVTSMDDNVTGDTLKAGAWNKIAFRMTNNSNFVSTPDWNTAEYNDLYNCYDLSQFYLRIESSNGWSQVDTADKFYFSAMYNTNNVATSQIKGALRITSDAVNSQAEGNAFALDTKTYVASDGSFQIAYNAQAQRMAYKESGISTNIPNLYDKSRYGLGDDYYYMDPWSDVKELAVTFRSTKDTSKAFTVYTQSRSSTAKGLGIRVAVEGEQYRNSSGNPGYAVTGNFLQSSARTNGSFGMLNNYSNASSHNYQLLSTFLKFDPATMCVYGYSSSNTWTLVRDLSSSSITTLDKNDSPYTFNSDYLSTLSASDFANNSYTVEIGVSKMNTEWNTGLTNIPYLKWGNTMSTDIALGYDAESGATAGTILASGYDRKCIIDICAVHETTSQTLTSESVVLPEETGYVATKEWVNMSAWNGGEPKAITLSAPEIVNTFSKTAYSGDVAYTADNGDNGVVTFSDGTGTFTPSGAGVYTFTLNGYTKKVKLGYVFTYVVDGETRTAIITDDTVDMSDYTASKEGMTFVGWTIDGELYSSEYSFALDKATTATATFIDFAMLNGASVRLSANSPGIRFTGTLSKADYDMLTSATSNVAFAYEMTGGASEFTTVTEVAQPTFNNVLGDKTGNTYYFYASVINLSETQYAMDFKGVIKVSFETADGVEKSFYALQESDPWRNITEVAQKALADEKILWSDYEKAILQSFDTQPVQNVLRADAGVVGHVQNTAVDAENGVMYYSFGKKVVAQNIYTGDVTGAVELYKDATGLSDYGDTTYASHMHGGTVGYYDGYVYVPFMGAGIGDHYQGANEIWQTNQCAYLVRIPVSALSAGPKSVVNENGSINETVCAELGVQVLHIGAPIMELTKDPYMVDGEEAWIVGGKYGVVNSLDAITFGAKMGGEADGKTYLTLALTTTQKINSAYTSSQGTTVSTATRGDANYMAFGQFDVDAMDSWEWVSYSELKKMEERGASAEEYQFSGPSAFDNFALFESGNADWGPQGICYDSYLDVYMIGTYGSLEKDGIYVDGVMGSSGYTGFISFMIDPRSATVKTTPKGTNGESEYILTAKYGKEGNFGVRGFACKAVWWDTGMASLGNGYYYIKDNWNVTDSFSNADGTSYAQMVLRKFDLKPDTMYTQDDPFTTVLASTNDGVMRISILGDSISTFAGVSNNTAYNSTIGGNSCHYGQGETDDPVYVDNVDETWWYQATEELGYELCVNNSYAGKHLEDSYNTRALELHNAQYQSPDVVVIYMGINDFAYPATGSGGGFASGAFGSFDGTSVPPESVTCFTEAYGRAIYNIQQKYVGVKVYCCTLLPDMKRESDCVNSLGVTLDEYNEAIRTIATNMGAGVIDLARDTGITPENCADYMTDWLHPDEVAMSLIADCVVNAIRE